MLNKLFQMGFLLYILALPAHASIAVSVNSVTSQSNIGDTVSFTIDISGLDGSLALSSYDLSVGFDAALLQFNSAVFGDPLLGNQLDLAGLGLNAPSALAGDGLVSLIEFSLDDSAVLQEQQASDFILASLFFTAISPGISPLNLTLHSLADSETNPLAADSNSASVSIKAVPIPAAIWLFTPALALLMRGRGNPRA